jgi:hypothetical protein
VDPSQRDVRLEKAAVWNGADAGGEIQGFFGEIQFQETISRPVERTPDLIEALPDPGSRQVGQRPNGLIVASGCTNPGLINGSTGSIFMFSSNAMLSPLCVGHPFCRELHFNRHFPDARPIRAPWVNDNRG